jgi:hypothetical protein
MVSGSPVVARALLRSLLPEYYPHNCNRYCLPNEGDQHGYASRGCKGTLRRD